MKEEKKVDLGNYVRSFWVFWGSLHRWVKVAILIVGALIGWSVWGSLLAGLGMPLAMIFLGQSLAADVVVVSAICVGLILFLALPIMSVMILSGVSYLVAWFVVLLDRNASASEFFFKS